MENLRVRTQKEKAKANIENIVGLLKGVKMSSVEAQHKAHELWLKKVD